MKKKKFDYRENIPFRIKAEYFAYGFLAGVTFVAWFIVYGLTLTWDFWH